LIEPDAAGGLTSRGVVRRNRNVRVEGPSGWGFLVKQADKAWGDSEKTLRAEAEFYRLCENEPALAGVAALIPRLGDYEPSKPTLVFELITGSVPLWDYYSEHTPHEFPVWPGFAVGHALGLVHRAFRSPELADHPRLARLSRATPWVLRVHKPKPDLLATLSPANLLTLRIIQEQEGLSDRLDALRGSWRPETLIHGDVRSDNVLLIPHRTPPETGEVRLVDWEFHQLGDPAWDLAGVLQDFVLFWTSSMPLSSKLTAEEITDQAKYPLASLHGALSATWHGYTASARLERSGADEFLVRAVAYSAARLIQSVYEMLAEEIQLTAWSVILLQVATNILADPDLATRHLYGFPRP
jgi:hypothetical protein